MQDYLFTEGVIALQYDEVNHILLSEFTGFSIDADDLDLPYIVAGRFTKYILEAYLNNDKKTYLSGLNFIETLHLSSVHKVRELATIGYLESIQNTWPKDLLLSNIPFADFGDESKKWWVKLIRFWEGDVQALSDENLS